MKRTKIVCTIGPSSDNPATLKKMLKAGMNVARLNFSHGTHESHEHVIAMIRQLEKELNMSIGMIQDLQGPRIRVGTMTGEIVLKKGQRLTIVPSKQYRNSMENTIPCQYEDMYKDVKKGHHILIADGTIDLKVVAIKGHEIVTVVEIPGTVKSHKGINVPGAFLKAPAITAKDKKDVVFGISQKVPYVAMSFVKDASEVKRLRTFMKKYTNTPPAIIAKIECPEAIKNLEEIIEEVDAVMVARGDLGMEMPAAQVPILQKDIIERCVEIGKPVIVATQMLESMISNRRPTRAEVSDVANAVFDETDAVMLSGESANGAFPVEAVTMMNDVIETSEASVYGIAACPLHDSCCTTDQQTEECLCCSWLSNKDVGVVVCRDVDRVTIGHLSSLRQHTPIFVLEKNHTDRGILTLYKGVYSFDSVGSLVKETVAFSKKNKKKFVLFFNKKHYSMEIMSSSHLTKLLS